MLRLIQLNARNLLEEIDSKNNKGFLNNFIGTEKLIKKSTMFFLFLGNIF